MLTQISFARRIAAGHWQELEDVTQWPRYDAILSKIPDGAAVLDVGCGAGILGRHLAARANKGRYLGIERNPFAASEAKRCLSTDEVLHTTDGDFSSSRVWDVIVMSEVLYYCSDPIGIIRRYSKWLHHNGRLIVTIYLRPDTPGIKARLLHLLNNRRPLNARHCAEMVDRYLSRHERSSVCEIPIPQTTLKWRMWTVILS